MDAAIATGTIRTAISPATRMGVVSLTVANLERQLAFYREILGFRVHWRKDGRAGIGAGGEDLVELVETPGARRVPGTTGLYHFAVLFPDRRELARAVARLFRAGYENFPTDHIETKTTYLRDPEGQEIELYAESPEDGRMGITRDGIFAIRSNGEKSEGREPLDLDALFSHLRPDDSLDQSIPSETKIGHVHLYVRDVAESVDFYTRILGFENRGVSERYQVGFVSAGGYHHHVGLNSWIGRGRPPAPEGSLGLRHFTVALPGADDLEAMRHRLEAARIDFEHRDDGLSLRDPSSHGISVVIRDR